MVCNNSTFISKAKERLGRQSAVSNKNSILSTNSIKKLSAKIITCKSQKQDKHLVPSSNFRTPLTTTPFTRGTSSEQKNLSVAGYEVSNKLELAPEENYVTYQKLQEHLKNVKIETITTTKRRRSRQDRSQSRNNNSICSQDSLGPTKDRTLKENNKQKDVMLRRQGSMSKLKKVVKHKVPELRDLNEKKYLAKKYLNELYSKIIFKVKEITRNKKMSSQSQLFFIINQ